MCVALPAAGLWLVLVSLVFQLNSGFLGLRGLAAPGVILSTRPMSGSP
ncbi:hypothetical protein GPX89_20995 [Nocardia sp. ET3-3]|uniref:Uncharacterized protein n=1 Tax=Nocardia terrae TaxID=2675851 RepID=A0A7K1UZK6_9NOCA|nr:hypothetical protein [Nocardia terrae]MVU79707.1 hypothetical protein [Nocardia terrae]